MWHGTAYSVANSALIDLTYICASIFTFNNSDQHVSINMCNIAVTSSKHERELSGRSPIAWKDTHIGEPAEWVSQYIRSAAHRDFHVARTCLRFADRSFTAAGSKAGGALVHIPSQESGVPALPNFGVFLAFIPTPFNAEQPNLAWWPLWGAACFRT